MSWAKFRLFLITTLSMLIGMGLALTGLITTNAWWVLLAIPVIASGIIWAKKVDEETNWP